LFNQSSKPAQAKNLNIMKQFFILFVSLVTLATAAKADHVTREIDVTQTISSIEISHEIDVVLTESKDATIRISGEESATKAVLYDLHKGSLRLLSKKGSLKNKVTVFVPVQNLRMLKINGTSYVRSNGSLTSNHLLVNLGGNAKVEIANIGDIVFQADEGIDMQIKSWSTKRVCQ
jgi:hypothetical protein